MKGKWKLLLAGVLSLASCLGTFACAQTEDEEYDPNKPYGSYELTEFITEEESSYYISGTKYVLTMAYDSNGTVLKGMDGDVFIQGDLNKATTITLKGGEEGEIRPIEEGKITFKNLTIRGGMSSDTQEMPTYRQGYFGIGGNVVFENCVILHYYII